MTQRSEVIRLTALLSLVAAILATLAVTWQSPAPTARSGRPFSGFEMSDEATGEYSRRHATRSDGVRWKTDIVYHNGSKGLITYRTDGTRATFEVVTADGWKRTQVTFDAKGVFAVGGFELRGDKTKKWEAETLPSGQVKTVTYWQDGKTVFAESVRTMAGDVVNTTFYQQNGVLWAQQKKWMMASEQKTEEDLYGVLGNLRRSIRFPRYAPEVTYYKDGGQPYFKHTFTTYSDEGGTSILLETATIYGDDGRKVAAVGFLWTHVSTYTVFHADGSYTIHDYRLDGAPQGITHVDVNGVKTKQETGADPELLKSIDPRIREQQIPAAEDLFAQWLKAEPK